MALAGSLLRVLRVAGVRRALVQVVVGALSLNAGRSPTRSRCSVSSRRSASVREVVYSISNGAASLNPYVSPVAANQHDTRAMLMACGLAVLWSVDVLAFTLRRPSLVGAAAAGHAEHPCQHPAELPRAARVHRHRPAVPAPARHRAPRPVPAWGAGSTKADQPALNVLWQVSLVAVVVRAARGAPGPGRRPAQPAARRRQRDVRVRPPAQRGQPLRQAATRPRREDAHPARLRPDRRPLDVVPAHDGARRVHQRRVAAVAAQPARGQHGQRRLPQRPRACSRRPAGSDGHAGRSSSRRTSPRPGCRSPTRSSTSTCAAAGATTPARSTSRSPARAGTAGS